MRRPLLVAAELRRTLVPLGRTRMKMGVGGFGPPLGLGLLGVPFTWERLLLQENRGEKSRVGSGLSMAYRRCTEMGMLCRPPAAGTCSWTFQLHRGLEGPETWRREGPGR